ncbi:MAG: hypothetical protein U0W40_16810 [Acidimicrobiia bacterium]
MISSVVTEALDADDVPVGQQERLGVPCPASRPVRCSPAERCSTPSDPSPRTCASAPTRLVRALALSAYRLDRIDDVVLLKGVRGASLSVDVETYRRELLTVAAYITRRRAR